MILVPLTQGYGTIVSNDDYERVMTRSWQVFFKKGKPYATSSFSRGGKQGKIWMHRFILDAPEGMLVDHRDGNGLDNTRENIRICTALENARNTRKNRGSSRFKGVSWDKVRERWEAGITVNGKRIYLGRFISEDLAAKKYDKAALLHFGDFARINFPGNQP